MDKAKDKANDMDPVKEDTWFFPGKCPPAKPKKGVLTCKVKEDATLETEYWYSVAIDPGCPLLDPRIYINK